MPKSPSMLSPSLRTSLTSMYHLPIQAPEAPRSYISSSFTARKSLAFAYGFTFLFISCATFLIFNSSSFGYSFYSSPWLHDLFQIKTDATYSYKSHFASIFNRFHSNSFSSLNVPDKHSTLNVLSQNNDTLSTPKRIEETNKNPSVSDGVNENADNAMANSRKGSQGKMQEASSREKKVVRKKDGFKNKASSPRKRSVKWNDEKWLEKMMSCDIFDGAWVRDDSYPLFPPGTCPYIDEPFNCFANGRPDRGYEKYRWQPNHCNIPRLDARNMLQMLKGKRLVFVGDSLNRNMWESTVCLLRNAVRNKSRVFEASGIEEFRTEGSYSFIFEDYNCSVEFFRSPFLVQEWEVPDTNGSTKETLRLDLVERSCNKYKTADVLIFNTGHWWTHEKTANGKGYYQEGGHVYDELHVDAAFQKALTTWARWVNKNVDPAKTQIFFRGYSVSHFTGGEWNSGGKCDGETEPLIEETNFEQDPSIVQILESVLKEMKTQVFYLNITRMTNFRRDAHPSLYREQSLSEEEKKSRIQDCSHWCIPGVPDTWNEIVYSQMLLRHKQKKLRQRRRVKKKRPQTKRNETILHLVLMPPDICIDLKIKLRNFL